MIVTRVVGGLGSQMFQYAAGRRLAGKLGTNLKLDLSWFSGRRDRHYALGAFNIRATPCSRADIASVTGARPTRRDRLLRGLGIRPAPPVLALCEEERPYHFDRAFLKQRDNVYLSGAWQSERYFEDIPDLLRTELSVHGPAKGRNRELLQQIVHCESVAVHVRRGDDDADPAASARRATCEPDYYHRAIAQLVQAVHRPHFFVFSDDPAWVRANLAFEQPATMVDHNGPTRDHEDMRLMRGCKHSIIANSAFGWWGAWLNRNPAKIVIAPKRWLRDEPTPDLVPHGWITT